MPMYTRRYRSRTRGRQLPPWLRKKKTRRFKKTTRGRRQGYININRKLPMVVLSSSGTVGNVTINDAGLGTFLSVGTPTASLGSAAGYYDVPFSIQFQLAQVENVLDLTTLFDQYKINGVLAKVIYTMNSADVSLPTTNLPYIEWDTDHDDPTPEDIDKFRERMGAKQFFYNSTKRVAYLKCKPRVSPYVIQEDGSAVNAMIPRGSAWLNTNFDTIKHYAIKGIIHNMPLGATSRAGVFQFDVQYNISMKDVQ